MYPVYRHRIISHHWAIPRRKEPAAIMREFDDSIKSESDVNERLYLIVIRSHHIMVRDFVDLNAMIALSGVKFLRTDTLLVGIRFEFLVYRNRFRLTESLLLVIFPYFTHFVKFCLHVVPLTTYLYSS